MGDDGGPVGNGAGRFGEGDGHAPIEGHFVEGMAGEVEGLAGGEGGPLGVDFRNGADSDGDAAVSQFSR